MRSLDSTLKTVFRNVFSLSDDAEIEAATIQNTGAWDSMGQMNLVLAIEEAFDIQFEDEQVIQLSSYKLALIFLTEAVEKKNKST